MFGQSIGTLNVLLVRETAVTYEFSVSGGQGPFWKNHTIDLPKDATIQVIATIAFILSYAVCLKV